MVDDGSGQRDLTMLVVPRIGCLRDTGELWEPYLLLDGSGQVVEPARVYLKDLQAAGRSAATQRSYGLDLLRWFRFLWAIGLSWDAAGRIEARDFSCWLRVLDKPASGPGRRRASGAGSPNPVTGRPAPGAKYAARTVAHSETVLRAFYDCHRRWGSGPAVNPFPLVRQREEGRAHAHHNPLEPFRNTRVGLYRPTVPKRVPRAIPDERFNELFAALLSHRDRALVAFYVSTGARASELLGTTQADADPGQQLISVVRKGSRTVQRLPASPDAFVWLRLYQQELDGQAPRGRDDPLWWTLRQPLRPLTYHAARAAFIRAQAVLGSNWTLHDLRHTAAYRMARDPEVALTDVQWVLGHASLTTTQIYTTPFEDEVLAGMRAHHERRAAGRAAPPPLPAAGYRTDSLQVLFGGRTP
ncbi:MULTISPECIES: tyrosine-type recombinase/integrase [Frankia]|uniref:tyrosine-type recombinase/integrase n=1 Tax=Frankia TaxID=1854 RepID=UPI0021C122A3|nr:tyrosine-type recombinase/integrase [Frankia tisae]